VRITLADWQSGGVQVHSPPRRCEKSSSLGAPSPSSAGGRQMPSWGSAFPGRGCSPAPRRSRRKISDYFVQIAAAKRGIAAKCTNPSARVTRDKRHESMKPFRRWHFRSRTRRLAWIRRVEEPTIDLFFFFIDARRPPSGWFSTPWDYQASTSAKKYSSCRNWVHRARSILPTVRAGLACGIVKLKLDLAGSRKRARLVFGGRERAIFPSPPCVS
jgi:hypothetical protein